MGQGAGQSGLTPQQARVDGWSTCAQAGLIYPMQLSHGTRAGLLVELAHSAAEQEQCRSRGG